LQNKQLVACLDANVLVSALAFGGIPEKVLGLFWGRSFLCVTSPQILEETRRTLNRKLALDTARLNQFLFDFLEGSTVLTPTGSLAVTGYAPDDLVLETALLGSCDVLVTGDKRHLLPLNPYKGLIIEPPSSFIKRLV
jgi:putative PIN family toxin of toxin-antitoxin system